MSTWTARPTMYDGIAMRSRLEAAFAASLDEAGVRWIYEPRAYGASGRRQYLPDFEVTLPSGTALVEVKPTTERAYLAMDRMGVVWANDPSATLIVTVRGGLSWSASPENDYIWRSFVMPWDYR